MSKKKEKTFNEAISELEAIVEKMESQDVQLEEAIKEFQEGMELSKICSDKLKNFEKQIYTLTQDENGEIISEPLNLPEE